METAETFYDELARDYDAMTKLEQRMIKEKEWLEPFVREHRIRSALDVACGTGIHSISLSQLGVDVVGTDISPEMLKKASANAERFNVEVRFLQMGFLDLRKIKRRFDMVLCLGNSLPHIRSKAELRVVLKSFLERLERDGLLVLQLVNYDRVLKQKERVISVRESGAKTYIRFYDFSDNSIRFNILTLTRKGKRLLPNLISTNLFPLTQEFLCSALSPAGFCRISLYGDLQLSGYEKDKSTDLIIVAGR